MKELDCGLSQEGEHVPETPGYIPPFSSSSSESELNSREASHIHQKLLFNFLDSFGFEKPHILKNPWLDTRPSTKRHHLKQAGEAVGRF